MKDKKLHAMFTSTPSSTLEADFSDIGEGGDFSWHQFHTEEWLVQEFDRDTTVALHNSNGHVVPLIWLLLGSQLTVDLITKKICWLIYRCCRMRKRFASTVTAESRWSTRRVIYMYTGMSGKNLQGLLISSQCRG